MHSRRYTGLLALTAVAVYAVLVAGATTAVTDAAAACPTWPACGGEWVGLSSPALVVVWTHRLAAAVVGLAVFGTAAVTLYGDRDRRVVAAVFAAAALYPLQVGIGALAAGPGTQTWVAALHLAVGTGIFASLVAALAWHLESLAVADGATAGVDTGERAVDRGTGTATAADSDDGEGVPSWLATPYAYVRLTKPRLMWLLCLVASAGMALAAGSSLSARTVALTLGGGVLAIGASGTFNNVLERDRDRRMARTADRPVATHEIPTAHATAFGLALAAAALAVFLQVNVLAAVLGLSAILFYSVVYTLLLKPNTVQNTVVGGFAGALPALIGVAAVTETVGVPGLLLATVIFLWTPAHFYNLALAYRDDYAAGGFPMLPVVRGAVVTRKHILWYLGATLAGAAVLGWATDLGVLYAATSTAFGAAFLWAVVALHREQTEAAAFRAFHASNAYLGALLVAVVVDATVI